MSDNSEKLVKDIRRRTRKKYSSEEKIELCWKACVVKKASPSCAVGKD